MEKSTFKTPTRADIVAVIGGAAVPILVLLWGMRPGNPYGYFVFLRIMVCLCAFVFAVIFIGEKREMLVVLFAGIAILFNPLFPLHLTRDKWLVFDALAIVTFCIGLGVWLVEWRKRRSGVMKENSNHSIQPSAKQPDYGKRFQQMGGHGRLNCKDCDFSESLTSFIHGVGSSSSGFQCQSCGKFTSRNRQEPFKSSDESDDDLKLSALPLDERTSRIEHLKSMINLCESQMKKWPRKDWLSTWEPTVAECKKELRDVPQEELISIKKRRYDFEKTYRATLFCECGGSLDREKTLFCPNCKSKNLSYSMEYIT